MNYGDETKKKYHRLFPIRFVGVKKNSRVWLFRCDCGTYKELAFTDVRRGNSKSCGCLKREVSKVNLDVTTHGDARLGRPHRIHNIWSLIKGRCHNKNNPSYSYYGGRGIFVCQPWRDNYITFKKWALANGYSRFLTIERIDNNAGYSPSNCRFATRKEQARNMRSNIWITFKGKRQCLAAWSEETGIHPETLTYRIKKNWPLGKLFSPPRKLTHG